MTSSQHHTSLKIVAIHDVKSAQYKLEDHSSSSLLGVDLKLHEHVWVVCKLACTGKVRAPQVMEVAAVGWAGGQGGVHLAQQQHDGQLYQVWAIKPRLLCCFKVCLHPSNRWKPVQVAIGASCSRSGCDSYCLSYYSFS